MNLKATKKRKHMINLIHKNQETYHYYFRAILDRSQIKVKKLNYKVLIVKFNATNFVIMDSNLKKNV